MIKILFLDQSGQPAGAELCLLDIAKAYRDQCLVGLFADGLFRQLLEENQIPVQVLATQAIAVHKGSGWLQGLSSLRQLLPLAIRVAQLSHHYDVIYANTQKAMVIGTLASILSRRPLVYHLHDILSADHFSSTNRWLAVTLANHYASLVITVSQATQAAFIAAGGRPELSEVVYNGFDPQVYHCDRTQVDTLKQQLGLTGRFVIGHFSRLSPWKGQHILLEALESCSEEVTVLLVGDALFGEQEYVQSLQTQVIERGLQNRVQFLGFRSDIVPLMHVCDLITHTSIAPEPFGRVIVEAMLCGRPVIATQAGGALELSNAGIPYWLVPPGNPTDLAIAINQCQAEWAQVSAIAQQAQLEVSRRFHIDTIRQQIAQLLHRFEPVIDASKTRSTKPVSAS
ncbi:glycosyltransferase family 4 protein [Pantanalinema sp. GBBB05]|uniref:glycosyltransferase family 4 protein n=1 Tax=Pantanalinema sp. GBBB05 TaxID=2604139 RepID=UPI003D81704A